MYTYIHIYKYNYVCNETMDQWTEHTLTGVGAAGVGATGVGATGMGATGVGATGMGVCGVGP